MTGPLARRALFACALALTACGEAPEADDASGDEPGLATDTTLAAVLLDLHLADARAETTGEPLDSLRAVAFAQHNTDSASVAQRLRANSETPEAVSALYGAVQDLFSRTP